MSKYYFVFCVVLLFKSSIQAQVYSALWGKEGEKFNASSNLGDFSFAGYQFGELEIPKVNGKRILNVKTQYGAKADGKTDDSGVIQKAINDSVAGDVIFFPKGNYFLDQQIIIKNKSNIVLRGDGKDQTIFSVKRSLEEIKKQKGFSWSGGIIYVVGLMQPLGFSPPTNKLQSYITNVKSTTNRGSSVLEVNDVSQLKVGQWVRLVQTNPSNRSLDLHLKSGYESLIEQNKESELANKPMIYFANKIKSINNQKIVFERPFPFGVSLDWSPEIHRVTPKSVNIGLENFTIHFPNQAYVGHWKEKGFNGIQLTYLMHSWVKNIRIINADTGINLLYSQFNTIENIEYLNEDKRSISIPRTSHNVQKIPNYKINDSIAGHHGIYLMKSSDNLIRRLKFSTKFIHDITTAYFSMGNVISESSGVDLCLDNHSQAPFQNLYTQLNLGLGSRPFQSGGGGVDLPKGSHSGSYMTLWNVVAKKDLPLPDDDYAPKMLFIGFKTKASLSSPYNWHLEKLDSSQLFPQNIYWAQKQRRMNLKITGISNY